MSEPSVWDIKDKSIAYQSCRKDAVILVTGMHSKKDMQGSTQATAEEIKMWTGIFYRDWLEFHNSLTAKPQSNSPDVPVKNI